MVRGEGGEAAEGSGWQRGPTGEKPGHSQAAWPTGAGVRVEAGMESKVAPLVWPAAPDSPDVAEGTHQKELPQGPEPQVLDLNDFGDFQRAAHAGPLAPRGHGERGLQALQKKAPLGPAGSLLSVWGSVSNG